MNTVPTTRDAFKFLMQSECVLTRMSANGVKVDIEYMRRTMPELKVRCEELKQQFLTETPLGQKWQSIYGARVDLDSDAQTVKVLKAYGFDKFRITDKGNVSVDKKVKEKLSYEDSHLLLKRDKLKTIWQNLMGRTILECDENGLIHPMFQIHTARTYRGSCEAPNLQNQPKHDEDQKHIIRSAFLPRTPDRCLAELDLRGNEVSCGCSIHHDKKMLEYLSHPETANMHKDVATHVFMLDPEDYTKGLRQGVKGPFVFAGFYGAGYESMARNLWDWCTEKKEKTAKGITILEHLANKGITCFAEFEEHIKKEYDWFWFDLFRDYGLWKEAQWEMYKRQGFLDYPTGFRATNIMTKTQAINTVVQGSSFHVLLAMLWETQKMMDKYKFKSLIVGEIHDSSLFDLVPNEYENICDIYLTSQEIVRKRWPWIVYPIQIEADLGDPGASWADLKEQGELKYKGFAA